MQVIKFICFGCLWTIYAKKAFFMVKTDPFPVAPFQLICYMCLIYPVYK